MTMTPSEWLEMARKKNFSIFNSEVVKEPTKANVGKAYEKQVKEYLEKNDWKILEFEGGGLIKRHDGYDIKAIHIPTGKEYYIECKSGTISFTMHQLATAVHFENWIVAYPEKNLNLPVALFDVRKKCVLNSRGL